MRNIFLESWEKPIIDRFKVLACVSVFSQTKSSYYKEKFAEYPQAIWELNYEGNYELRIYK
tara:strand:+ start:108 stop:290 length:183 start_codon:yes stop_codon:yes gene_type:complete